jgi:hypothetical protein
MVSIFNFVNKGVKSIMSLLPTAVKNGATLTTITVYALFLSYSLSLLVLFALLK